MFTQLNTPASVPFNIFELYYLNNDLKRIVWFEFPDTGYIVVGNSCQGVTDKPTEVCPTASLLAVYTSIYQNMHIFHGS